MTFETLIYYGLKVFLLSLLALGPVIALRKTSSSTQNAFTVSSLFVLLLIPLLGAVLPEHKVAVPDTFRNPVLYAQQPGVVLTQGAATTQIQPKGQVAVVDRIELACNGLIWAWLGIASFLLLRLAAGFFRLLRWAGRAKSVEQGVVLSQDVKVPLTAWVGRTIVMLPAQAVLWDNERLARVLAHERAHIARRDIFWNLVGQIACACYWPIPTIWVLHRIARETSERACDDKVLRSGALASDYAKDLLDIAREGRGLPFPALPMANRSEVGVRVKHILDPVARRSSSGLLAQVSAGVYCLIALPVAVMGLALLPSVQRGQPRNGKQRNGTPGTPANNFVGTLPDGRKVQLIQIERLNGQTVEAWKPDGARISTAHIYGDRQYWNEYRKRTIDPRYSAAPLRVAVIKYLGGSTSLDDFSTVSLCPFDTTYSRTGPLMAAWVVGANYKIKNSGETLTYDKRDFRSATMAINPRAPIPKRDSRGVIIYSHNKIVTVGKEETQLTFVLHHLLYGFMSVVAYDRSGKPHLPIATGLPQAKQLDYINYQGKVYFDVSPSEISRFDVRELRGVECDFTGFKTAPHP